MKGQNQLIFGLIRNRGLLAPFVIMGIKSAIINQLQEGQKQEHKEERGHMIEVKFPKPCVLKFWYLVTHFKTHYNMAKLVYKKIEVCGECPEYFKGQTPNESHCKFTGMKLDGEEIPRWCHLVNYEEKEEGNETGRVWVKIRGR